MDDLLAIGAAALRKAALNESAKEYILKDRTLFPILKRAADRYIAGETLAEAVEKVAVQNRNGYKCSLEFMGESTKTEAEAVEATNEFLRICQTIRSLGLNSTVSLDLSHIGLAISNDLGLHHLDMICKEAAQSGTEVIVSAEGTERTDAILETYQRIAKKRDNISITLQAYLHRTKDDFQHIIKNKGRVRIVKGAFETEKGLSVPRGSQLNDAYLGFVDQLLSGKHPCSIATHDAFIQQEAKKLVDHYQPQAGLYEFESLYGIQNERLAQLKAEGYATKLYFVYGKEWYLYVCNRIAEFPLNVFLALQDVIV
ncbi:proline dehydrogenase family protein [Dyadobacter sp. CY326]|uniref:proline dehydrogenase family protein n=1 Tax=Dyadobacter sp. CY326 TaxID=2907300 RepID=UPI001F210997|nr:proline dehydrogenase family protein [Dyadobacter sp. CY326]MCE7066978.1 proline dehydrogenase family protein [Dyadobacter sp. CY326]